MKIFWRAVTLMPNFIGHPLIRRNFKVSYDLPEELVFKVAQTTDEIEQAFRIIHDGFVESKLMDPNEARLRITKYYCLPSTALLVCKHKDEVIATISLIGDSAFGLPTEEFRDLSEFRDRGMKLAEISGLAIKKNNQAKRGKLLLPLFKFMYRYAQDIMKADGLVISTTAEVREFYRALFFFRALDNAKVVKFSTVKNRETVSQILYLKESPEEFRKHYGHLPKEKNLYDFFELHAFKQFRFPELKYPFSITPVFTVDQMKHFFLERTKILDHLDDREKVYLSQYYPHEEFRRLILKDFEEAALLRKNVRTPVSLSAALDGRSIEVVNVSFDGLKVKLKEMDLRMNDLVEIAIDLGQEKVLQVKALVMWVTDHSAGLKLDELTAEWMDMIDHAHLLYRTTSEVEAA